MGKHPYEICSKMEVEVFLRRETKKCYHTEILENCRLCPSLLFFFSEHFHFGLTWLLLTEYMTATSRLVL